jgi:hypothetical protein
MGGTPTRAADSAVTAFLAGVNQIFLALPKSSARLEYWFGGLDEYLSDYRTGRHTSGKKPGCATQKFLEYLILWGQPKFNILATRLHDSSPLPPSDDDGKPR